MNPTVLVFTRHYLPGFRAGGPIRTIANLVECLGDEINFRIVTLDRDIDDTTPYKDIRIDTWMPCGKALVRYVLPNSFRISSLAELVESTPHDVVYLNSFFDTQFTLPTVINRRIGRLTDRPIIIAARGQFSPGALRLKSNTKKAYIFLAKSLRLYEGLTWQASSDRELRDIEKAMFVGKRSIRKIIVAPNFARIAEDAPTEKVGPIGGKTEIPLNICTLSRISPMKNLDFALSVLGQVDIPVRFDVYGPIEDRKYWALCEGIIANLPSNIEVVYSGAINPSDVLSVLARHDLFFLPTRGENFGHVIQEALTAGLPCLISDQTPWKQLEEQGVGWGLALEDMSMFVHRVEEVAGWSRDEREQRAARARALASRVAKDQGTLEANRRMFLNAIDGKVQSNNCTLQKSTSND